MTELTPRCPKKSISLREREQSPRCESSSRQSLFANTSAGTWSLDEVNALVEFVLFHSDLSKYLTSNTDTILYRRGVSTHYVYVLMCWNVKNAIFFPCSHVVIMLCPTSSE